MGGDSAAVQEVVEEGISAVLERSARLLGCWRRSFSPLPLGH